MRVPVTQVLMGWDNTPPPGVRIFFFFSKYCYSDITRQNIQNVLQFSYLRYARSLNSVRECFDGARGAIKDCDLNGCVGK